MRRDDTMAESRTPVLESLLELTGAALKAAEAFDEKARETVAAQVTKDGRVSAGLIEAHQTAAHGLAWVATYVEALRQMQAWAEALTSEGRFGEIEQLIHQIAFGEYLWQLYGGIPMSQGEIVRAQDLGMTQEDQRVMMAPAVMTLTQEGNTQAARLRLVELSRDRTADLTDTKSELPHMLPDEETFARECAALGIGNDTHVVVYDSLGLFSAARA